MSQLGVLLLSPAAVHRMVAPGATGPAVPGAPPLWLESPVPQRAAPSLALASVSTLLLCMLLLGTLTSCWPRDAGLSAPGRALGSVGGSRGITGLASGRNCHLLSVSLSLVTVSEPLLGCL